MLGWELNGKVEWDDEVVEDAYPRPVEDGSDSAWETGDESEASDAVCSRSKD